METKLVKFLILCKKSIIELIYPRRTNCIICKNECEEALCTRCYKKIKFSNEEFCVGYYGNILKELILRLKYKKDFEAGEILVKLLMKKITNIQNYNITYIPIDDETLKERGFNQCEYLAKEIAYLTDTQIINSLMRVRNIKKQKTLSKEERFKNVEYAFKVIKESEVCGKNFILIDDVITTGATLTEGIRALKKAGASEIKILTVAKSYI